jgi:flagellar hook assembly protein FlgD
VSFDLASRGRVRIGVYDILGRRVATIADRVFAAGRHRLAWDGRDDGGRPLASGVYFCRLDTGERRETKKMVLAR